MPNPDILVIDNYLRHPERILADFKASTLTPLGGFRGIFLRSRRSAYRSMLHRQFERTIGCRISWGESSESGEYRCTTIDRHRERSLALAVHVDPKWDWNFIIYLSPEEDCQGGTGFFRHKETGLDGLDSVTTVRKALGRIGWTAPQLFKRLADDASDSSKWLRTDMVYMRHNRLVAFNAKAFHSHVLDFGATDRTSIQRITYVAYGTRRRSPNVQPR